MALDKVDEKLELSHQSFTFGLELGAIDKEKKTVSFILSDETVVNRGWYDLKLLHSPENVSLERKSILKLFFNHNTYSNLPLGKWNNVRLDGKKLKADSVFDTEDTKSMEIFGKVERGFLDSVSVGVDILQYTREQREGQNDLVIATKWEIYEASIVSIPAIPNAKVGLDKEKLDFVPPVENLDKNENNGDENMTLDEFKKKHPELFTQVFDQGVDAENSRVSAILTEVGATALTSSATKEKLFDKKSTVTDIQASLYIAEKDKKEKMAKDIKKDGEELADKTNNIGGDANNNATESRHEKMMKRKEKK